MNIIRNQITAVESCEMVLQALKSSKLNFSLQETPYSAYITVRKRFQRNLSSSILAPDKTSEKNLYLEGLIQVLNSENSDLKDQNNYLTESVTRLVEENKLFAESSKKSDKLHSELRRKESKDETEIKVLKDSLKKTNNEAEQAKNDLKTATKNLKTMEKENFSLNNKNDNLIETTRKLKAEKADLLSEVKKLEKKKKQSEKKSLKSNLCSLSGSNGLQNSSNILLKETLVSSPNKVTLPTSYPESEKIFNFDENLNNKSFPSLALDNLDISLPETSSSESPSASCCLPRTPPGTPPSIGVINGST